MRKIMLAVSALAAVVAGGALSGVRAAPLGNPAALAGAAEETGIIESVHCRPGWRHHYPREWRRADGCRRGGDVVVVPGRTRFIYRDGVRVRVGGDRDFRSRTSIRSRETTTTTRSRGDSERSTIRSGSEGGSTTTTRSGRDSGTTTTRSGRDGGGTSGGNTGARQGGGGSATQQSPSGGGGGAATGGGGGGAGRSGGGGAGGGGGGGAGGAGGERQ